MTSDFGPIFAQLSSSQQVALAIVAMGLGFLLLVSLAGIIVPAWASVSRLRMETALKQHMVERGMSAEEILSILRIPEAGIHSMSFPCASEVVIERDQEWHPGFVLKHERDRYLVHYVGSDMSENEWVSGVRVRFPASSKTSCGSPSDWTDPSFAFGARSWFASQSKPAPVEQEI